MSHDLTHMTEEKVVRTLKVLTELIKEAFPGVPLIVSIGNHDFEPANYQNFDSPKDEFLQIVSEIWKEFLTEEAYLEFQEFGYFSMV